MNKITKKTISIVLIAILASILMYFFLFYLTVTDVKNVNLSGYIFDKKTKKPINNVLVIINNERYEDDKGNKNYDEYLGKDTIELYSDSNGYFSAIIEKSAFVNLAFKKDGYIRREEKGRYAIKKMRYEIYLNSR